MARKPSFEDEEFQEMMDALLGFSEEVSVHSDSKGVNLTR